MQLQNPYAATRCCPLHKRSFVQRFFIIRRSAANLQALPHKQAIGLACDFSVSGADPILDIDVVEDVMLATSDGQFLPNFLGEVSDVLANLRRLGMAAGLTPDEWAEYRQLVGTRLRLRL